MLFLPLFDIPYKLKILDSFQVNDTVIFMITVYFDLERYACYLTDHYFLFLATHILHEKLIAFRSLYHVLSLSVLSFQLARLCEYLRVLCSENVKSTLKMRVHIRADQQSVRDLSLILAVKLRQSGSLTGEKALELGAAHILHVIFGTEIVFSCQGMRYHM